jgi:predicted GNAT family N-acyltransferase
MLTTTILTLEQWRQLDHAKDLPDSAIVFGVLNEGEIIATFASQPLVYLSHLWVKEDMRGRCLSEQLVKRTIEHYSAGTPALMLTVNRHVEKLAHNIGMTPMVGSPWWWSGK